MNHSGRALMVAVVVGLVCCGASGVARADNAEVRGKFLRLAEKKVGEREHLVVVVQPAGRDEEMVLIVPRRDAPMAAARRLRKGQKVEITYVVEDRHKWIKRIETGAAGGEIRGKFVRLAEKKVGEREYLAVVVQPLDADAEAILLVPREAAAAQKARRLRKGQKVEIVYVVEAGEKWVRRLEAERLREDEPPQKARPAEGGDLRAAIRRLEARLAELQRVVQDLRAENRRLRQQLKAKPPAKAKAGEPAGADRGSLPAGMKGFKGMLVGTIQRRLDRGFVLKVEKVTKIWEASRAENPRAAVGREVTVLVGKTRMASQHLQTLRGLKAGDRVEVEAFGTEAGRLDIIEALRKVD